jgi:hypothetical protein
MTTHKGKKRIADTRATLQDAKNKILKCTNKETHKKKNYTITIL